MSSGRHPLDPLDAPLARDIAYQERNRVAVLAAALARRLGMRVGVYDDPAELDDRFAAVLQIDLPTGQVTFHLDAADEGWTIFGPDWHMVPDYDDHDEDERWDRISRFVAQHSVHSCADVMAQSFRRSMASLEEALKLARHQREQSGWQFKGAREDLQKQSMTTRNLRKLLVSTAGIPAEQFDEAVKEAEKLTEKQWRESEENEEKP